MNITPDILVVLVTELQYEYEAGLVPAARIAAECRARGIDLGGSGNTLFKRADYAEAGATKPRLLKFKVVPTPSGRVHFAVRHDAPRAPAPNDLHPARVEARTRGWVECVWNGTRWTY